MANELNFPANKNIGDVITLNDLNFVWDGTSWNSRPKPSDEFFIAEGGNVGIGTTTPSSKLQLSTDAGRAEFVTEDRASGLQLIPSSGSIELWDNTPSGESNGNFNNPHIDFKTSAEEDYDCRIIKQDDGLHFRTGRNTETGIKGFWFTGNGEAIIGGGAAQTTGPNGELYSAPDPDPFGKLDVRGDAYVSDRIRVGLDHSDQAGTYPLAQITATRKGTRDHLQLSANDGVTIYTGNDWNVDDHSAVDPITDELLRHADFIVKTYASGNKVGIGTSLPARAKLDIVVPIDEGMPGAFIEGGLNVQPVKTGHCLTNFTAGNYDEDFDTDIARSYVAAFTAKDDSVGNDLGGVFIGCDDNNGDENALLVYNQTAEENIEANTSGKSGELFRVRSSGDAIVFGNLTVKEKPAFELVQLTDITGTDNLNGSRAFEQTRFNQGMNADGAGHIIGTYPTAQYFRAPIDGIYHFSASIGYKNGNGIDDSVAIGFGISENDDEPNGFYNNTMSPGNIRDIINPKYETGVDIEHSYSVSRTTKLKAGAKVWFNVFDHNPNSPLIQFFATFSGHQVG